MQNTWFSEIENVLDCAKERHALFSFCEHLSTSRFQTAEDLLSSAVSIERDSYLPLCRLSVLLDAFTAQWPLFKLLRCFSSAWKALPEYAKRPQGKGQDLIRRVDHQVKALTGNHLSLLQSKSTRSALHDPTNQKILDHRTLYKTVQRFSLPPHGSRSFKPIVAIALPNGPTLAVTVLATSAYYTAVPLNTSGGRDFRKDALSCGADTLLVGQADVDKLGLREQWVADAHIRVFIVDLNMERGALGLRSLDGCPIDVETNPIPNTGDDRAILLFTSGTSGNKKLVPLTHFSLVAGASFVMESWKLTVSDVCLNMMPLTHVGGLVRNLFAPLFAGGSTICCSAFDPNLFWDIIDEHRPTWYYASPSMHTAILDTGNDRIDALQGNCIRFVANAAGGLLPSLAGALQRTFGTVLPSYGMTECQPISSPPLDYCLERPGTSGVSVGPEMSVLGSDGEPLPVHTIGRVAVRGPPVFPGYLKQDGTLERSGFNSAGWFDTGDLGYLDESGYLYITGRSKEVINRGGEIISPFEIEEAIITAAQSVDSPIHGRVSQALAFSVPHQVLQEAVAVVLVTPRGSPRADIRSLQEAVKPLLQPVKVPVLLVFMDALPKRNNKVLRIRLGERLNLTDLPDELPAFARHLEAICPPHDTDLDQPIRSWPCHVDYDDLTRTAQHIVGSQVNIFMMRDLRIGFPECVLAPRHGHNRLVEIDLANLQNVLKQELDGYAFPSQFHHIEDPLPSTTRGSVDEALLREIIMQDSRLLKSQGGLTSTEQRVIQLFMEILSCLTSGMDRYSDFFKLGGDSLRAGRLLSLIRKTFQTRLAIDTLFAYSEVGQLAEMIDGKLENGLLLQQEKETWDVPLPESKKTYTSTNPLILILQLVPLVIIYPAKRALTWTIWMFLFTWAEGLPINRSTLGRLLSLILSLGIARAVTKLVAPLVAIVAKWLIIGQYKEGLYPMWGVYHTRWWMVQKILSISGKGVFNLSNWSRVLFYRLLGARIGQNVTIDSGATLGEYDLITIGDDVILNRCTCRPFAAERNASMYLGRITFGRGCTVGLTSHVAAGASLPPFTSIGPNSCNWEALPPVKGEYGPLSNEGTKPHWTLNVLVIPLQAIARLLKALPWMAALIGLVIEEPGRTNSFVDRLTSVLRWFTSPHRLGFHYLAVIVNALLAPVILFFFTVLLKKIFNAKLGKPTKELAERRTQIQHFHKMVIKAVFPVRELHKFTELFGQHYEITSMALRALGARIGSRVYWPGTGPSLEDYDLLDVGDDVVFGSRAYLVTSDDIGSEPICIQKGAMVSDRVTLLPGVEVGEKTVMGSGALTRRNVKYPSDTTWIGSKQGEAVCLTKDSSVDAIRQRDTLVSSPANGPLSKNQKIQLATDANGIGMSEDDHGLGIALRPLSSSSTLAPPYPTIRATSADSVETWIHPGPNLSSTKAGGNLLSPRPITPESPSVSPLSDSMDEAVKKLISSPPLHPIGSQSTSTPFGRAFYSHIAPYYVLRLWQVVIYTLLIVAFTAFYWNVASTSAIVIVSHFLDAVPALLPSANNLARPLIIYMLVTIATSTLLTVEAFLALAVIIASKWLLIGRRTPGSYDWDTSSYNQRWQVLLTIEKLRRHCYGGQGILGLLTGTHYMVLYFRALGARIGKDCALFASGAPSLLFTEPDLLQLGNRVVVDDASLVGHINSRGNFRLNGLSVGDGAVLRSGSRLLSGARMESESCLLEHTLVMAGDVVEEGECRQGWPAEEFKGRRVFLDDCAKDGERKVN